MVQPIQNHHKNENLPITVWRTIHSQTGKLCYIAARYNNTNNYYWRPTIIRVVKRDIPAFFGAFADFKVYSIPNSAQVNAIRTFGYSKMADAVHNLGEGYHQVSYLSPRLVRAPGISNVCPDLYRLNAEKSDWSKYHVIRELEKWLATEPEDRIYYIREIQLATKLPPDLIGTLSAGTSFGRAMKSMGFGKFVNVSIIPFTRKMDGPRPAYIIPSSKLRKVG